MTVHVPFFSLFSKRMTVHQCLAHPWIAEEEEPPSPSPLMLKIPAPDPYMESKIHSAPVHHPHNSHSSPTGNHAANGGSNLGSHHGQHQPGHAAPTLASSRRSCHTGRDKVGI